VKKHRAVKEVSDDLARVKMQRDLHILSKSFLFLPLAKCKVAFSRVEPQNRRTAGQTHKAPWLQSGEKGGGEGMFQPFQRLSKRRQTVETVDRPVTRWHRAEATVLMRCPTSLVFARMRPWEKIGREGELGVGC